MARAGILTVKDLTVVEFRSGQLAPQLSFWRRNSQVPFAESCSRQIWYGPAEDFKSFPANLVTDKNLAMYSGAQAYAHLLKLNLGYLSGKIGESNIKGQFFNGWEKINSECPAKAALCAPLVQGITADVRFIQMNAAAGFRSQRHELCARDLSGFGNGDRVLVVGHMHEGRISEWTDGICRVTTSNNTRKAKEIALTHPDENVFGALKEEFLKLYVDGKIGAEVSLVNFSDMGLAVEMFDRIFIVSPMEETPEADEVLIDTWRNRVRVDNTLTHMRLKDNGNGVSTPLWKDAGLENYIAPEEIFSEARMRRSMNEAALERGERACEVIAQMRLQNARPSKHAFSREYPELLAPVA